MKVRRTSGRIGAVVLAGALLAAWPGLAVAGTGGPDPGANCSNYACYTLTVSLAGNGSGTWKSTNSSLVPDGRINCQMLNGAITAGSQCAYVYGGIERASPITVYFLMTAEAGSDACSSGICDDTYDSLFTLNSTRTVEDEFRKLSYPLNVSRTGTGTGNIMSAPEGINCGATCSASYLYGTSVQLSAIPNDGSIFGGWTGACAGQQVDCLIGIVSATTTAAIFNLPAPSPSPTQAATPTATPKATAVATPKATTAPSAGPSGPAATGPDASGPAASGATASGAQASAEPSPATSGGAGATPTVAPIESPATVPAAGSPDGTLALAILGAGVAIALAIGLVGFAWLRRSTPRRS